MSHAQTHRVRRVTAITLACLFINCFLPANNRVSLVAQDAGDKFDPPGIKAKAVYSPPERFPHTNEWEAFRVHAISFLTEYPDDEMAPTALRDLIVIEGLRSKPNPLELNALKARSLLKYPESLTTLMTLRSFKAPIEFRTTLLSEVRRPNQSFSPDFSRSFLKACELGLLVVGPNTIDDDDFLLLMSLAMRDSKSTRLRQFIEQKWTRMKEPAKSAIELSNDDKLKPADKVGRLHDLAAARQLENPVPNQGLLDAERFWMTRLLPEERKLPRIREILIERLLEKKRFAAAITELDQLLASEKQPKWMFWRAWSLAIELDFNQSLAALDQLAMQFPNDDWSKHGARLADLIRDQDAAYHENAQAILETAKELQATALDLLQIHVSHTPARGKSFEVWANADAVNSTLNVFIKHDSKPLVGYQSSFQEYSLFLRDQGQVFKVNKPGLFPEINLGINATPDGLDFNVNFNAASTQAAATSWQRTLLGLAKDPALGDVEAILRLVRLGAKPAFPVRMKKAGESRIFLWYTPAIHTPEMTEFEIEVSPIAQHQFRVRFGKQYSAEVVYGKAGSLPASSSQWENIPVVKKDDLDIGIAMHALSIASSIFQPQEIKDAPAPASPASQPKPSPPTTPPPVKKAEPGKTTPQPVRPK